MIPAGAMGDSRTRVLLAVVNQWRPTVRSVAAETGLAYSSAYAQLRRLRADGLVDWKDNGQGTLRALVRESHEHLCDASNLGQNGSGRGAAQTAPDRAQHRSRRR